MASTPIADDRVVVMHYTVTDADDEVVDSSRGRGAFAYLHGHGNIVSGLEAALAGREAGDSVEVTVEPADAYGEHNGMEPQSVPRREIPKGVPIEAGVQFLVESSGGDPVPVWIVGAKGGRVTVDTNHPLAGKTLHYTVQVLDIRDGSPDERRSGQVES